MLVSDMFWEGLAVFFDPLSADIANVALVLFIVVEGLRVLPQFPEGVEHQSGDDVAEKHAEEDSVYGIKDEPDYFELLHGFRNGARNEQGQDTTDYPLTHLLLGHILIHVLHVVAESDCAEDGCEDNPHEADQEQRLEHLTDGLENAGQDVGVADVIHDMDEVQRGVDEGAEEGDHDEQEYFVEIVALIELGTLGVLLVVLLLPGDPLGLVPDFNFVPDVDVLAGEEQLHQAQNHSKRLHPQASLEFSPPVLDEHRIEHHHVQADEEGQL